MSSAKKLPDGWKRTALNSICELQAGKFVPASEIMETCNGSSYPCYGGNGLRGFVKDYSHSGTFPLIGRQGALCGNINKASGRFYATEHAVVATPNADIEVEWLYYQLIHANLNKYATGAAQPGLSVKNIKEIPFVLPPLQEQKAIADLLSTWNEAIEKTERLIQAKERQKIYGSKACGLIENERIHEIGKNANFRSDKNIVACLNRMRPELPQYEADPDSEGEIHVFHSNAFAGNRRTQNHWQQDLPEEDAHSYLERVIRDLKAQGWGFEAGNSKILMLTNNVLASEQKYRNLTGCFRDTDDFLKKNDHYIKFFLDTVEPLCDHFSNGHYGEMFSVLGNNHPRLACKKDKVDWSANLLRLLELRRTGSIREVLELLKKTSHPRLSAKVASAEERLSKITEAEANGEEIADTDQKFAEKIRKIEAVPYLEVMNLYSYVEDKTPFSTKHGVKGAEFDEVLVVCGRGWNHYNWNQFLEWSGRTVPAQKQDAYERNRNLFYVSCSRAKKKLALLFTQELSATALQLVEHIFGKDNVHGKPGPSLEAHT